jgi:hypothetical protein
MGTLVYGMENTESNRNRSSGWKYAKKDGHAFEDLFAHQVMEDKDMYAKLRNVAGLGDDTYPVSASTTHDRVMPKSVFGDTTTSKTDVTVFVSEGAPLDISLKKPSTKSGQVLLCKLERFLRLIETKSKKPTPLSVRWALRAFLGETDGMPISKFAPNAIMLGPVIKRHGVAAELYQNRLYGSTLAASYPEEWQSLQDWFKVNMAEITDCCFRSGMCADALDERSTAEYVFVGSLGSFFTVSSLVEASRDWVVTPSSSGYYKGSTLRMPWGFLQGHRPGKDEGPYQVQFHWVAKDMLALLGK